MCKTISLCQLLKPYLFAHPMGLLVGSLIGLLVGKSYHTRQKDGYNLPTNDPTNNHTNWIWMSKKIGLK